MKKILITGCAGHFGSELSRFLLSKNYEIIGVDSLQYSGESMLSFFNNINFNFINTDITKDIKLDIPKIDLIIHLAAYVSTLGSQKFPDYTWETNYTGAINLLDWAKRNNINFLFASTCSNYGVSSGLVDESAILNPLGPYAEAKVKVEQDILSKYPFAKVFRVATLAGISTRPRFDTMLNEWVLDAHKNDIIKCYSPKSYRPFIHISDAINSIYVSINKWNSLESNVYNIVGFNTTKEILAKTISRKTGCKLEIVEKGPDNRNYQVDSSKFNNELNFSIKFDLDQCIEEVYSVIKSGILKNERLYSNFIEEK